MGMFSWEAVSLDFHTGRQIAERRTPKPNAECQTPNADTAYRRDCWPSLLRPSPIVGRSPLDRVRPGSAIAVIIAVVVAAVVVVAVASPLDAGHEGGVDCEHEELVGIVDAVGV